MKSRTSSHDSLVEDGLHEAKGLGSSNLEMCIRGLPTELGACDAPDDAPLCVAMVQH